MKFKCVKDKETTGFFTKREEKIIGLTVGKTYTGNFITIVSCNGNESQIGIMIFDDKRRWNSYDRELLIPGDENDRD